ncbi:MAG: c-type cytochrome, partial [Gammaproteobacteria bacterium]|nr:c-type cytochrome [Gammaproteobacteria bacterium]
MPRFSLVLVAVSLTLGVITPCVGEPAALADEGRQIYRTAIRSDGSSLRALVQNDVPLPPSAAACVNCHRRSGYGISEGGSRSRNLTAPALFEPTTKPPIRPAYDDQTLIRAIVAGIAADGSELHANMPRYELSARDAEALTAYLRTLGANPAPGVSASELTIATVIAKGAPAAERDAVETVLQRFVELKNAQIRQESERAAASNRQYYGRSWQRAFRNWSLQVWTLTGPTSTWREQLESYQTARRPFAIVSGTAGPDWSQVHDFCEANEVPCLLPLSRSPKSNDADFYSLYYSTGALLEARVT